MSTNQQVGNSVSPRYMYIVQTSWSAPDLEEHILIVADYVWYGQQQDQIDSWMTQSGVGQRKGMVIDFKTPAEVAQFLLVWG